MPRRLTDLLSLAARSGEDRFPIVELFTRPGDLRLSHAALDTGSWIERRQSLVSVQRFGAPSDEDWPLELSREEVEAAPEIEPEAEWSWTDLPPILTGPFGYTISPLLIAAQTAPPSPGGGTTSKPPLEPASGWIGRPAFDASGALGPVADLDIDAGMAVEAFLLEDGSRLERGALSHVADQGHVVFRRATGPA